MFVKKYLLSMDRRTKTEVGTFIAVTQAFVFLLVFHFRIGEVTYLSFIPIICTAFFFGEMAGLFFGAAVATCFSPLWIDLSDYGSPVWVIRAFGYAAVGLVVGNLSNVLRNYLHFEENIRVTDISTGLPNRQALCDKLAELSASQASGHFAIVVIVISNRKILSETFGNDVTKSIFNQFKD
jgi:hypothetical protein